MRIDLLAWAAFGLPLIVWLSLAGSGPGWGMSPGLIAAAWSLEWPASGISLLSLLPSRIVTLLPFGEIAFRLTLLSALWMALSSWLFYRIAHRLLAYASRKPLPSLSLRLAILVLTLGIFGGGLASSLVWLVGPNALSLVLLLALLDALLDARFSPLGASRLRHLRLALLWALLGLLHQPLLALPWLPFVFVVGHPLKGFPGFPRVFRRLFSLALASVLLLLVIVPLEHAPLPSVFSSKKALPPRSSEVSTLPQGSLIRVMSAKDRPFLDELVPDEEDDPLRLTPWLYVYPSPPALALLLGFGAEHLGLLLLLLAGLGCIAWFFVSRFLGLFLASCLLLSLWPLLWLPFQIQDSSFQATLFPFLLLLLLSFLSILAPLFAAPSILRRLLAFSFLLVWTLSSWLALWAACGSAIPSFRGQSLLPHTALTPSPHACPIRRSHTALRWSEMLEETLPLDAILVTSQLQDGLLRWYRHHVELHRPDVILLSKLPTITPRSTIRLFHQSPDFARALHSFRRGDLSFLTSLKSLSKERPICIEWHEELPPSLALSMYPIGLLFFWSPDDPVSLDDVGFASDDTRVVQQQERFWKEAYRQLLPFLPYERHLLLLLLETHLRHARFFQQSLRWQAARAEIRRGLFLMPSHPVLRKMLSEIRSHPFFLAPRPRPPASP